MSKVTTSLLIPDRPIMVLPSLAQKIGLNEAIVLQQIHYWLQTKPHEIDGKLWTYNTLDEWQKNFPFWSKRTIQRILKRLEQEGLIKSEKINKHQYDQTKWYTINYDNLPKVELTNEGQNDQHNMDNLSNQNDQHNVDNLSKSDVVNLTKSFKSSCPPLHTEINYTETIYTETNNNNNTLSEFKNSDHDSDNASLSEKDGCLEEAKTSSSPPKQLKQQKIALYKPYAEKLAEIIRTTKNIKITARKVSTWADEIRKLVEVDGVAVERVEQALDWYADNIGGEFVPVIESGRALRDKFLKLENAMRRSNKAPSRNARWRQDYNKDDDPYAHLVTVVR